MEERGQITKNKKQEISTQSLLILLGALTQMERDQAQAQCRIAEQENMRSRLEFAFGTTVDDELVDGMAAECGAGSETHAQQVAK